MTTSSATSNPLRHRARSIALCAALALGISALAPSAHAQKVEKLRHIVLNVKPEYPASLRAAHVGGVVKLNVTASASGNVTKIELIGGNPIFADCAIKAVMKWKYAPAPSETTSEVEFRFNPDSPNTR